MPAKEKEAASRRICQQLQETPLLAQAKTVLLYWPLAGEVDVRPLLSFWQAADKRLCLPRLLPGEEGSMEAALYAGDQCLACGAHGILQPADTPGVPAGEVDWVIVPGLAFDRAGYRLGFGGGYYDRYLSATAALRLGVCWDACLVAQPLPREEHDLAMDYIATETHFFASAGGRM